MEKLEKQIEDSIKLSVIDLKCNGAETVNLFDIFRNSLDFVDKSGREIVLK